MKRRRGNQEIRSLKDVVSKMHTGAASRALSTIAERTKVWAKRYDWQMERDYELKVQEFGNPLGGGVPGVGVCKTAGETVFNLLNKA